MLALSDIGAFFELLRAAGKREEGQTMAEYAVVLAVITVLVVGAIVALSTGIVNKLGEVTGIIENNG